MSNEIEEGMLKHDAAFPVTVRTESGLLTDFGLSRRDYLAAAALTGYLAHHGEPQRYSMDGPSEEEQRRVASLKMYRWADAMLAAGQETK